MTEDEFFSLPAALALRVLFDCLDEDTVGALKAMEKPKVPLPPKFDQAIYRRDGVQWASETDLSGLRFWHQKSVESAASGSQYAANDRKRAESLARWVAWRGCFPDAVWNGERNHEHVQAATPSARPMVYETRRSGARPPVSQPQDDGINPDDDIPF